MLDEQENDMNDDKKLKTSLTNWENEPKLSDLKTDLEESQSDYNLHVQTVESHRDYNDGKANFSVKKGRSKVVPKLIRKQAEWRYSALSEPFLSTEDVFNIDPVTFEDTQAAEQNQLVLNNQFNTKMDKVAFIDEYVRTAVDDGTVFLKVGWIEEKEERTVTEVIYDFLPVEDPEQIEQLIAHHAYLEQMVKFEPSRFKSLPIRDRKAHAHYMRTGTPVRPVKKGVKKFKKKVTVRNHPTVEVCEYDSVIPDPTCKGNLDKAKFVIYKFESSLSELRQDGRYHNLDFIKKKDSPEADGDYLEETTFQFQDKPRQQVTVHEYWGYWDIDGDGIVEPFVAAWVGDVLIRMEKNPFPDQKVPFVKVVYLPKRNRIYGDPDGELLKDNQDVIGAITRGMIDMMGRSAAAQQGINKEALDVVNSRKFERGEDFKFNPTVDPKTAFHMQEFPEIPNSAMNMIQFQTLEAESITGVKSFSEGISGQSLGSTATSVRGALDAASKRELGILRRLAEGIIQVGRKFIAMNAEFLDESEVVRVTNEEFVEVRRDDLLGNFDLKLSISTAEADNAKAEELAFMLQTTSQSMAPELSNKIMAKIARLRKMPDLAKELEDFVPQPDPLAVEKAQLEVELLRAQIRDLDAKANENAVDVGLKEAKTATEHAKARQMHSSADQTDLNFLEQKSGVAHNREIDKQQQKGQQDMALKRVDQEINREKITSPQKGGENLDFLNNFSL